MLSPEIYLRSERADEAHVRSDTILIGRNTMKLIISAAALVLTVLPSAVSAQATNPDVSTAPSAQSSGTGIPGQPGNKSGPPAKQPPRD